MRGFFANHLVMSRIRCIFASSSRHAIISSRHAIISDSIMRKIIIMAAFLSMTATLFAGEPLTIPDITSGRYSAENLRSLTPLADGVSFAQTNANHSQILRYSFVTGKQTGVIFDVNDTNGDSIASVDGYIPSPDGKRLLVYTETSRIYRRSFKARFLVYDVATHHLTPLSANGNQQSPVWSPDGSKVAFVRDNNIFLVDIDKQEETPVTTDGRFNEIINGIPDWVNEEEFSFSTSMAFTPDSRHLCWIRYDESGVKTYSLQLFQGLRPQKTEFADYPGEYSYKYPKAGQDNAVVTAWRCDLATMQSGQIPLPLPHEGYIPRIFTGKGQSDVLLYTLNRHQDSLTVYAADASTLQCRKVLLETVPKYISEDVLGNIQFNANSIVFTSDRSGTMQVYVARADGTEAMPITNAKYGVTNIYGYDEKTGKLYYQAAGLSPMEREVYVTDKKGKTTQLTRRRGWNSAVFSADYKCYILTWSDMNNPYECDVFNIKGKKLRSVVDNENLKQALTNIDLPQKELFSFTTSEGVTLNGWMVKPHDFDPTRKYPVVMFQYSGPGNQQVVNSWGFGSMGQGGMYDAYLAQQGFIVACTDGRGTGGRGAEFEKCTYLKLGELEARDQVETAIYLSTLPYVDADNIGIWGWSYGGFCTLMSMSEGRGVFKAGVAVAPPTNWRFYDSIYTERFMRTPAENPDGYDTNPTVRADKLHGSLLICHGMADDNVHPQNTFEYSEALVQADKDFKEIIYTNRNHSIYGGNTRNHLLRQIAQFFEEKMK